MSVTPEPMPLGSQISLFDYALGLHEKDPDSPLPRDGEPYPDNDFNRRRDRPPAPDDRRRKALISPGHWTSISLPRIALPTGS
jgi:hypothetical protein